MAWSVQHADPLPVGVAVAVLAAASAYGLWRAWRNARYARIIEDTPTARARSIHQGYAELEGVGRLMDGPPIVAPLSGKTCVWYRFTVEEQRTVSDRGGSHRQWVTVRRGISDEMFWLEDTTGRVAIDPEGAEVNVRHKETWYSGRRPLTDHWLLSRLTDLFASPDTDDAHRYTEERIHPGERLYALGMVKNIGSFVDMPDTDEEARQLLIEWKRDQPALLQRFDLNQDGRIDEKEWMLARAQARREVLKTQRTQQIDAADAVNLLSCPEDRDQPFILSAYPQTILVTRYRRTAAAWGGLFFLGGSAALWLFNHRFL
jgi:hypothetical protein